MTEGMTTVVVLCVNDFAEFIAAAMLLFFEEDSPGLGVETGSGSTGGRVKLNLFFDILSILKTKKIKLYVVLGYQFCSINVLPKYYSKGQK